MMARKNDAMLTLLAVFMGLLLSSSAFADKPEPHTGLWLKYQMDTWERVNAQNGTTDSPKDAADYGLFIGYINGVSEALSGLSVCIPSGSTYDQSYAVVAKYLKDNPEKWHLSPFRLTSFALKEAFPCQKRKK